MSIRRELAEERHRIFISVYILLSIDVLIIRKITFQTSENQNCFMYSVDHNAIFAHMHCYEPGNLLNIQNVMLKYQY